MQFVRTGKYRPDALNRVIEVDTLKEVNARLKQLDYLLELVQEMKPEAFSTYIHNLTLKYVDLFDGETVNQDLPDLPVLLSETVLLKEHIGLVRAIVNYILQILKVSTMNSLGVEQVVNRDYYRSFSHPSYNNLVVLSETIPRDEAIALYKRFVTQFRLDTRDPNREVIEDLESLHTRRIEPKEEPSDWELVHAMYSDGKYAFRNNNCVLMNAIGDDLPDTELKYHVCCYGDYEAFRNYHDSIILTMEHTIAQGHPYCSRVLHDTRVDWDLRHPPQSFWDSMDSA